MKIIGEKFKHAEAFCIMQYRCEKCGFEEKIWNSRDGVTPFIIGCPSCGSPSHKHINFERDAFSPNHSMILNKGDRFFIDMTIERSREYAVVRVDRQIEVGFLKQSQRNFAIKQITDSYFGDGCNPDIAVKQ